MIFKKGLNYSLLPNALDVLRHLFNFGGKYSTREIARLLGRPHTTLKPAVDSLIAQGVLTPEPVGRSILLSLNCEHIYYSALKQLFKVETGALKALAKEIVSLVDKPIASIFAFGSVIDGSPEDLDLLVLGDGKPLTFDDFREVFDLVNIRTGGMNLDLKLYTFDQFAEKVRSKDGFLKEFPHKHMCLYGKTCEELFFDDPH